MANPELKFSLAANHCMQVSTEMKPASQAEESKPQTAGQELAKASSTDAVIATGVLPPEQAADTATEPNDASVSGTTDAPAPKASQPAPAFANFAGSAAPFAATAGSGQSFGSAAKAAPSEGEAGEAGKAAGVLCLESAPLCSLLYQQKFLYCKPASSIPLGTPATLGSNAWRLLESRAKRWHACVG